MHIELLRKQIETQHHAWPRHRVGLDLHACLRHVSCRMSVYVIVLAPWFRLSTRCMDSQWPLAAGLPTFFLKSVLRFAMQQAAKNEAEKAERYKEFTLGKYAYGKGQYQSSTQLFTAALDREGPFSPMGGEIQLWLALAYQVNIVLITHNQQSTSTGT